MGHLTLRLEQLFVLDEYNQQGRTSLGNSLRSMIRNIIRIAIVIIEMISVAILVDTISRHT